MKIPKQLIAEEVSFVKKIILEGWDKPKQSLREAVAFEAAIIEAVKNFDDEPEIDPEGRKYGKRQKPVYSTSDIKDKAASTIEPGTSNLLNRFAVGDLVTWTDPNTGEKDGHITAGKPKERTGIIERILGKDFPVAKVKTDKGIYWPSLSQLYKSKVKNAAFNQK